MAQLMQLRLLQLPWPSAASASSETSCLPWPSSSSSSSSSVSGFSILPLRLRGRSGSSIRQSRTLCAYARKDETQLVDALPEAEPVEAIPKDLEYVQQIKRVLELLRKNRDMLFSEVKLTVMIEDPRDDERKRLLGIEDPDDITREDLAAALEDVYEGRVPENRDALRMLAEEMINCPNLEVAVTKKKPTKSLYAKATDIGVDPAEAAKRLNMDWDAAAEIEGEETDEMEVPPAVGYGALYLVTALPLIIGISVVLILFYNSLQ